MFVRLIKLEGIFKILLVYYFEIAVQNCTRQKKKYVSRIVNIVSHIFFFIETIYKI